MYVIALIGIGLFLHGFIMLTYTAFKVKKQWGLAVMLVPFAQIFFPIYHWEKSKSAFSSFILGISLWLGTAIIFGEGALDVYWLETVENVQSAESIENFSPPPPLSLEQRSKKFRSLSALAKPITPVSDKPHFRKIDISAIDRHKGKLVKIQLQNKIIRVGILAGIKSGQVNIQKQLKSGDLSYAVPIASIHSIYIKNDS